MYELRERLRHSAPELHQTLERCWEIALNEWIPAMGIKRDSYNSYPHLRNLENYLTHLIRQFEGRNPEQELLSPVELYVLLSAILFHDIGRLDGTGDGHAEGSYRLVIGQAAALGLHSPELARTIARICRAHDYGPDDYAEWERQLTTTVIDPYGEIRERVLAALLTLVDHLDSSHLRVLPLYLRATRRPEIVGAFREVVRGTRIDLEGRCVRVVLGDGFEQRRNRAATGSPRQPEMKYTLKSAGITERVSREDEAGNMPYLSGFLTDDGLQLIDKIGLWKCNESAPEELLVDMQERGVIIHPYMQLISTGDLQIDFEKNKDTSIRDIIQKWSEWKHDPAVKQEHKHRYSLFKIIDDIRDKAGFSVDGLPIPGVVIDGISLDKLDTKLPKFKEVSIRESKNWIDLVFLLDELKDNSPTEPEERDDNWPKGILLATLMKDTFTNSKALKMISRTLSGVEIPLDEWLLEYREKLYDASGHETFEPIFTRRYLEHVFGGMHRLSTEVFPHGPFTYEALASEVRDPDVAKIKRAVRRISLICKDKLQRINGLEEKNPGSLSILRFWCSDTHWDLHEDEHPGPQRMSRTTDSESKGDAAKLIDRAQERYEEHTK